MLRSFFITALVAACASACTASPAPSGAAPAPGVADLDETSSSEPGLAFGYPDQEGVAAQPLIDLSNFLATSTRRTFSITLSKNGRVVYEQYTSGLTRAHAHYLMSVTKSFTSALVGIAIAQGLVPSADASIADALPAEAFPTPTDRERFRSVTVKDVLGMSALDAQVPPHRNLPEDQERGREFFSARNRATFALGQALLPAPGVDYQYTDITPLIATALVSYPSHTSALEFANANLFGPMGFQNQEWMHEDVAGLDNGAYGLRLRPVDMQKFGLLYLHGGVFEGRQLIPAQWVESSFTPWLKSSAAEPAPNYGWYWWTFDFGPGWTARVCDGWKGQRIIVVPEQNVVVTMTGVIENDEKGYVDQLMRQYIEPAVQGTPDASLRQPLRDAIERARQTPPRFEGVEARMIPSVAPKEQHHPFRP